MAPWGKCQLIPLLGTWPSEPRSHPCSDGNFVLSRAGSRTMHEPNLTSFLQVLFPYRMEPVEWKSFSPNRIAMQMGSNLGVTYIDHEPFCTQHKCADHFGFSAGR